MNKMKTEEIKPQDSIPTKIKQEERKVSEEPIMNDEKNLNNLKSPNEEIINNVEALNNEISQELNNEIQNQEEENKNQEENISENNEEDLKFKFKEKLLTNEIHRIYGNRLREDYKYDNEGENGLFEASPRIVKIAGFELNKKIMRKIIIINKSKYTEFEASPSQ